MTEKDKLKQQWPDQILSGADDNSIIWTRQKDRASVTKNNPGARDSEPGLGKVEVLGAIDEQHIVVSADPEDIQQLITAGDAIPAYGTGNGPAAFIPTGRVFVRVEKELALADFETRLRDHGFTIVQPHSHFAFAGWIAADSESVADALVRCAGLRAVEGIVVVEPEMLGAKASR